MRLTRIKGKRVPGFTLVEMAIVLVIIGIILAGIMKGRDIVRGSQVKQFSQGFAQKWVTIASTYFDKVGQQLFDGVDNGGHMTDPDGLMDGYLLNQTTMGAIAGGRQYVLQALRDVGITPCTMIKSDLEDDTAAVNCNNGYNIYERMVEGEFTGKSRVCVGFHSVNFGTNGIRNCVTFVNVPSDVAIGLDTLIDGQADGENGSCLCIASFASEGATTSGGGTFGLSAQTTSGIPALGATTPIAYPPSTGNTWLTIMLVLDY